MRPFVFFGKQTPYPKPLKRDKSHFAKNAKIRTCLPSEQVRILLLRCMLTEMMRFSEAPVFPKSKPSVSGFDFEAKSSGTDKRQNRPSGRRRLCAANSFCPAKRIAQGRLCRPRALKSPKGGANKMSGTQQRSHDFRRDFFVGAGDGNRTRVFSLGS